MTREKTLETRYMLRRNTVSLIKIWIDFALIVRTRKSISEGAYSIAFIKLTLKKQKQYRKNRIYHVYFVSWLVRQTHYFWNKLKP